MVVEAGRVLQKTRGTTQTTVPVVLLILACPVVQEVMGWSQGSERRGWQHVSREEICRGYQ